MNSIEKKNCLRLPVLRCTNWVPHDQIVNTHMHTLKNNLVCVMAQHNVLITTLSQCFIVRQVAEMFGTLFMKFWELCSCVCFYQPNSMCGSMGEIFLHILAISEELLLVKLTQTWHLFPLRLQVLPESHPGCLGFGEVFCLVLFCFLTWLTPHSLLKTQLILESPLFP